MSFNELPDNVLLKIFSYLNIRDRLNGRKLLCKKRRYLALYEIKKLFLFRYSPTKSDRYSCVNTADCGEVVVCSKRDVCYVIKKCFRLQTLHLYDFECEHFKHSSTFCKLISSLEAIHMKFDSSQVEDNFYMKILGKCYNLKEVSILNFVSDSFLTWLLKRNQNLQSITLDQVTKIIRSNFTLPPLKKFTVNYCSDDLINSYIEIVCETSKQSLEILKIPCCNEKQFNLIAKLKNLRSLSIFDLKYEDMSGKWNISFIFQNLQELHISTFDNSFDLECLTKLIASNKSLAILRLIEQIESIDSSFIKNLPTISPQLRAFISNARANVNNEWLLHLSKLKNLEMICLKAAKNISDECLCNFIRDSSSLRFVEIPAHDADYVLCVFVEKAVQNKEKNYFCNFNGKEIIPNLPKNIVLMFSYLEEFQSDYCFKFYYANRFNLDLFAWKISSFKNDDFRYIEISEEGEFRHYHSAHRYSRQFDNVFTPTCNYM
ncbi:hypothetical protein B4U80_13845 [Leptotrombidium deliense]|uniref:F-box domain-containing protein n=1 Tax=Leptotrombidium deliense TaxID=299467 RepID=A0A443SBF7_9ACAR|nr:hypothetical protein B4U80_13845 [Leptotrombidium deliense]